MAIGRPTNPPRQTYHPNAQRVCDLFAKESGRNSGIRVLAEELGVDPKIVYRWTETKGRGARFGLVPPYYNLAILEAADRLGIPRASLEGLLEDICCPTCGQALPQIGGT